jgi:type IV secretory pathway ATPase VirB11/archaellum biosynthesis ATPase
MMNDKILENYQEEVLDLFKSHYRKMSANNLNLSFETVLQSCLNELGIKNFKKDDIQFLNKWFQKIHFQSFISDLLGGDYLQEIIFHSHCNAQKIFQDKKETIDLIGLTEIDYQLSLEIFSLKNNIAWNFSEPFASFTAIINEYEIRFTLIHYSTSADRKSKVFLRVLQKYNPTINLFKESIEIQELLINLVLTKKNILISGSTSSGKTTFLRALLSEIPEEEHVVVLEDTHEILTFSPNQTSFLAQNNLIKKSLTDYCSYALRMSPDRIILGEMRSNEVVPFMLAMNTGHKGLLSTIHSNSAIEAISRLALLFSLYSSNSDIDFNLITKLACKNIDYVIHMENKSVNQICRIIGSEGETPFYETIYTKNLDKTS